MTRLTLLFMQRTEKEKKKKKTSFQDVLFFCLGRERERENKSFFVFYWPFNSSTTSHKFPWNLQIQCLTWVVRGAGNQPLEITLEIAQNDVILGSKRGNKKNHSKLHFGSLKLCKFTNYLFITGT